MLLQSSEDNLHAFSLISPFAAAIRMAPEMSFPRTISVCPGVGEGLHLVPCSWDGCSAGGTLGQGAQMLLVAHKKEIIPVISVQVLIVGLGTWVGVFAVGTAREVVALWGFEAGCLFEVMCVRLLNSCWIYLPHFSLLSWSLPSAFWNLATRKDSIFCHACVTYAIKCLSHWFKKRCCIT